MSTANQTALDARSEKHLKTLVPAAQLQMRAFVNAVNAPPFLPKDWCFVITSGTRDADEQNALYAQGRTEPGRIVTYAQAGQSNHNYLIAIDITLFNAHHETVWDSPLYAKAGALGKQMGLDWGGDWKFRDEPHYQCRTGKSVAQLRALVEAKGGLQKAQSAIDALVKANAPAPVALDAPPLPPAPKWKIAVNGVAFFNYYVEPKGGAVMVPARAFLRALLGETDARVEKLGFNDDTDFVTLDGHDLDGAGSRPIVAGVERSGAAFAKVRSLCEAFGGKIDEAALAGRQINVTRKVPNVSKPANAPGD